MNRGEMMYAAERLPEVEAENARLRAALRHIQQAETLGEAVAMANVALVAAEPAPPIYDPKVDMLAQQPWFRLCFETVETSVQALAIHGFRGRLNVQGGVLHVR